MSTRRKAASASRGAVYGCCVLLVAAGGAASLAGYGSSLTPVSMTVFVTDAAGKAVPGASLQLSQAKPVDARLTYLGETDGAGQLFVDVFAMTCSWGVPPFFMTKRHITMIANHPMRGRQVLRIPVPSSGIVSGDVVFRF